MKREGNINFEAPLELSDGPIRANGKREPGTPVEFLRLHWWPWSRYKYLCQIKRYGAADQLEWFDKDGAPQRLSLPYNRLKNPKTQATWICNDTRFWYKAEALNCATSNGLTEPMEVTEVVTTIDGGVISRNVMNVLV